MALPGGEFTHFALPQAPHPVLNIQTGHLSYPCLRLSGSIYKAPRMADENGEKETKVSEFKGTVPAACLEDGMTSMLSSLLPPGTWG